MKNLLQPGRWLIAPALLLAFCSKGNAPSITGPSIAPAPAAVAESGSLGISATGDVKVGTGTLEFLNLAIWGFNGDPGAGGYINPGGSYGITPGVEVKLWATYVEGSPANPKFMVDWGDGSEPSAGGCGACKATHKYAIPGLYTVKATLDDRASTMVTRTFLLDARAPAPVETTIPTVSACATIKEDFNSFPYVPAVSGARWVSPGVEFVVNGTGGMFSLDPNVVAGLSGLVLGPGGPLTITFDTDKTFATLAFMNNTGPTASPVNLQAFDALGNLVASASRTAAIPTKNSALVEDTLTVSGASFRRLLITSSYSFSYVFFDNLSAGCS